MTATSRPTIAPKPTPRQPKAAPPPGMYENVDPKEYHSWSAWNISTLKRMDGRTPAHMHEYLMQADEPSTPAQALGGQIHTAILEPAEFAKRYVRKPPELNRRTNEGKEWWAKLVEQYGEDRIVDQDAYEAIQNTSRAAWANPVLGPILRGASKREVSLVWADPETGLLCKGRYDLANNSARQMIDIKTCDDASPEAFSRTIENFGYHLQAAHLTNGIRALGGPELDYCLAAFEKEAPYAVATYYLGQRTLEIGQKKVQRLLDLTASCIAAKSWPGYPGGYRPIDIPTWAMIRDEEAGL